MNEEDLEILFNQLGKATYVSSYSKESYQLLYGESLETAKKIIKTFFMTHSNQKIAELEAKVYTYEKIIANSNFAPLLEEKNKKVNEKNRFKDEKK